jgi:hypothetical protein
MDALELAKSIAEQHRSEADSKKADFAKGLDAVFEAVRRAAFIDGVLVGVRHGLSALDQVVEKGAEGRVLELQGAGFAAGTGKTTVTGGEATLKRGRNPPGHNESVVERSLGKAPEGATITEIIKAADFHFNEELADSSTRVALERLEVRGRVRRQDSKWFLVGEPPQENPSAGAPGRASPFD